MLIAVERWVLRVGVFLLPLAYSWNTYDRYVLPKLLLARVLVIALIILFVGRALLSRSLVVKRTPLDLPLLIFIFSALLSTLLAYNQNVAVFGTYGRYDGLLTILTYTGLFWLSVQALAGPDDARALLRTMLASGYLVAAVAILQSATDSTAQGVFVPAFGTLGQKNVLGILLAMLGPLAYRELAEADSWSKRILALNIFAVIAVALLLTLSRSAWLGAALAAAVLIVASRRPSLRLVIAGVSIALLAGVLITALTLSALQQPDRKVHVAALTIDVSAWGSTPARPYLWRDSLTLIASRPVFGYGLDNFGLAYPHFQSTNLGPQQWDKAHAESLQVAATQGLVGLGVYAFVLAGFVRAFWRGRRSGWAAAIFAGWVAYQVTLQLNFTALAAALPFWAFAAGALESWGATETARSIALGQRRSTAVVAAIVIAALSALAVVGTVPPYLADAHLLVAVKADVEGRGAAARSAAAKARELAPRESVYAVEAANIAFERADWASAADAYLDAARLGTYNPLVYRNLALADRNLGRLAEARAAARAAFELDRFDPANRALLAEFKTPAA